MKTSARLRKVTVAGYCGIQDTALGSDWRDSREERHVIVRSEPGRGQHSVMPGPGRSSSRVWSPGEILPGQAQASHKPCYAGCPGNTEQDWEDDGDAFDDW